MPPRILSCSAAYQLHDRSVSTLAATQPCTKPISSEVQAQLGRLCNHQGRCDLGRLIAELKKFMLCTMHCSMQYNKMKNLLSAKLVWPALQRTQKPFQKKSEAERRFAVPRMSLPSALVFERHLPHCKCLLQSEHAFPSPLTCAYISVIVDV